MTYAAAKAATRGRAEERNDRNLQYAMIGAILLLLTTMWLVWGAIGEAIAAIAEAV
jgi:hypothetical protein